MGNSGTMGEPKETEQIFVALAAIAAFKPSMFYCQRELEDPAFYEVSSRQMLRRRVNQCSGRIIYVIEYDIHYIRGQ